MPSDWPEAVSPRASVPGETPGIALKFAISSFVPGSDAAGSKLRDHAALSVRPSQSRDSLEPIDPTRRLDGSVQVLRERAAESVGTIVQWEEDERERRITESEGGCRLSQQSLVQCGWLKVLVAFPFTQARDKVRRIGEDAWWWVPRRAGPKGNPSSCDPICLPWSASEIPCMCTVAAALAPSSGERPL